MPTLGIQEIVIIAAIILLLFGGGLLRGILRGAGETVRELRAIGREVDDDL